MMTGEELLTSSFLSLEVNADFSEAVVLLRDGSRLHFCHRVGERWARAVCPEPAGDRASPANEVLSAMALFRLNAKHLDIQFADGSRWEMRSRARPG